MNTTLNEIRAHHPCEASWKVLLLGLGKTQADDEPLAYSRIMEICGLSDCLWAIAHCHPRGKRICADFSLWCAEGVREHMSDPSAIAIVDMIREYLDGGCTIDHLQAARAGVYSMACVPICAARAADWAAYSAACAANCAADCASGAADCAADCAADYVARAAEWAARAEDWAQTCSEARGAVRIAQKSKLIALLEGVSPLGRAA